MFGLVRSHAIETPSKMILQVGERSSKKTRKQVRRAHKIEKSQVRGDVKLSAKMKATKLVSVDGIISPRSMFSVPAAVSSVLLCEVVIIASHPAAMRAFLA